MWYEILSLGKHPLIGVIPHMLGDPFGPKGVLLSMSAEQIASKWSFRLVGNTPFWTSPDGGPEMV